MNFSPLRSGTTVGGNEIKAFISENKGDDFLYLMAGVHGDEVEGVYVLQKLYDWLQTSIQLDIPIVVIPILNIDGYTAQTRVNANGVDLNRNLPTKDWKEEFSEAQYNPGKNAMSEPENIFLEGLFQKFNPKFIYSFHSWKPIVNYNGDCLADAELVGLLNHYPVAGDIGYPTPGSLGTFAPEKYQCPVITFECPKLSKQLSLEKIWQDNRISLMTHLQSELLKNKFSSEAI